MASLEDKILGEGVTFDDLLLVPAASNITPDAASTETRLTRGIRIGIPLLSAPMDTVTEAPLAIALAQEGGIGVLHKNMSINDQANKVRTVKRAESGMIIDPVVLTIHSYVKHAKENMTRYKIGGIPIVSNTKFICIPDDNNESNIGPYELGQYGFQNSLIVNNSLMSADNDLVPIEFDLYQNHPNPFNPLTTIQYDLPIDGLVNVQVYDMMGRMVKTLVNSSKNAGQNYIKWNGTNDNDEQVSAGLYLYTIQIGEYIETKKMVLLK